MGSKFREVWAGLRQRSLARPLIPLVLALMAGIASPAWGLRLPDSWLLGGILCLLAALGLTWWRQRPARLLPLTLFYLLGVAFYQQALEPPLPPHHLVHLPQAQDLTLLGHLNRPGKRSGERSQLFVQVEAWGQRGVWRPATGLLLVTAPVPEAPPVGTGVVLKGRLRAPRVLKNPGTFDRSRHLAADGIFREVRLRDRGDLIFLAYPRTSPLREKLRGGIRRLLKDLDRNSGAIYQSMLLGDQGEITPEMRLAFTRTGTSHLLVINGLHLSMVAAVVYFLTCWALRRSSWLLLRINVVKAATLLAAAAVTGYAWVAGGSPSTQRAEIMVLAYLLLVFLGRPRGLWSALALAALAILTLAPLRLFAISFQLSFAAVAGLILAGPWITRGAGATFSEGRGPGLASSLLRRGKELLLVSLVATLATAPLVAAYFQVVSLGGIVVNTVAIPLVLGLSLPLGEAAVLAQALSLTSLAKWLLAAGKAPLWLGFQAISWTAQVPGSAMVMAIPTGLQMAAYYLLLALLLTARRATLTLAGAVAAATLLAASVALPLLRTPQSLEVTCLDTGGALAGVVVTPGDRRLVFSAPASSWPVRQGSGPGPLPGYLHWRQFRRLDQVAALGLSQGNASELLALARQFSLGGVWYGRRGPEGPAYWDLWNFLGDRGRAPHSLKRGRPPEALGPVRLAFPSLGPEVGVALQLDYQGQRVLIFPPLRPREAELLSPPPVSSLNLLVLPGQLARSPVLDSLLSRFKPEQLVIYGSPGATLPPGNRLGEIPCHLTREGAVSVYLSASGAVVRQRIK
jgi:competence protein ComEC